MNGRAKMLVAGGTLLAVWVSTLGGAVADTHSFDVGEAAITVVGDQEEAPVVSFGEETVTCSEASYHGGLTVPSGAIRISPLYSGKCESGSGLGVEVTGDGCDYVLGGATDEAGHGHLRVDCNHSSMLSFHISELCQVHISDTHGQESPVNQTLGGLSYENIDPSPNGKEAVTVAPTVTGIAYVVEGSFCALAGLEPGTYEDGALVGDFIVTGQLPGGGASVGLTMQTT